MEIYKKRGHREDEETLVNQEVLSINSSVLVHKRRFKMVIMIARNIFLNPIILMTILGIIGNCAFKHKVPLYLSGILEVSVFILLYIFINFINDLFFCRVWDQLSQLVPCFY